MSRLPRGCTKPSNVFDVGSTPLRSSLGMAQPALAADENTTPGLSGMSRPRFPAADRRRCGVFRGEQRGGPAGQRVVQRRTTWGDRWNRGVIREGDVGGSLAPRYVPLRRRGGIAGPQCVPLRTGGGIARPPVCSAQETWGDRWPPGVFCSGHVGGSLVSRCVPLRRSGRIVGPPVCSVQDRWGDRWNRGVFRGEHEGRSLVGGAPASRAG